MNLLLQYSWPGNVRELENVMTSAIAFSNAPVLGADDFASHLCEKSLSSANGTCPVSLAEAEKEHLKSSLDRCGWNITRTARVLDISPTTLRKKISDFSLEPGRRRSDG